MDDPTWASVLRALRAHGEVLFGAGIGLVVCAVFVRLMSRRRSARAAIAGLCLAAALELGLGAVVRFTPLVSTSDEASPEREALLGAAFRRVEVGALALIALALVGAALSARRLSGARFAVCVASLGVAGQALWIEVGVRERLGILARADEYRSIERRAIRKCLETPELLPPGLSEDDLVAAIVPDSPVRDWGVERVSVSRRRAFDTFPYHCLASASDVWCYRYSTPSLEPLERLVCEPGFTTAARTMQDVALVEWIAFALGVYVWEPSATRSVTDGEAEPARVERDGARIRIVFWERHPLIPGFGVQLRHTEVVLEGRTLTVTRGPMGPTLRPQWDDDSL